MFNKVFDLEKILSTEGIDDIFDSFKTNNWKKLDAEEKYDVFKRLNDIIRSNMGMMFLTFVGVHPEGFDTKTLEEGEAYNNIKVVDFGAVIFYIKDLEYNQYKTLHDYLYQLRLYLQDEACNDCLKIKGISEETIKEWKNTKTKYDINGVMVTLDRDESDLLGEFASYRMEANRFADDILVDVIRRNYSEHDNNYDEELFMADYEFLRDRFFEEEGMQLLEEDNEVNKQLIDSWSNVQEKIIAMLNSPNLQDISDRDLYLSIYPSIINCFTTKELTKIYKELGSRLSNEKMSVWCTSKNVIINYHVYSEEAFRDNAFNILLYEILTKLDSKLRKSNRFVKSEVVKTKGLEEAIREYKTEWLYNCVNSIDKELMMFDFGPYKYQPLNLLLNEDTLDKAIGKSKKGQIPYKRGR